MENRPRRRKLYAAYILLLGRETAICDALYAQLLRGFVILDAPSGGWSKAYSDLWDAMEAVCDAADSEASEEVLEALGVTLEECLQAAGL